ncbi:Uncharacterised protein [Mycobacteroides abscessus subsp. massiliense]|nr:Uncharacterised protein [Mycobacteroides abscessus subsp. massiliense]
MGQQQCLQLRRRHLVALVLDEFLEPVHDRHHAIGAHDRDIAGMQEPVGLDRRGGGFLVAEVSGHHVGAAY